MPIVSFEEFLKQAGGKPLDVKPVQPTETIEPIKKTLGEKIITPAKESVASLLELYGGGERGIATKLKEDIKAGAEDIEKGDILKGVAKTGFRTAGDIAGTIYAPIGALLGTTGLNKLFEKVGEISQMGGKLNPINLITDIPEVQQFVEKHPNLEEDFGRMANLIMSGMEKGRIEPKTVIPRTIEQAKIAGEVATKPIKIAKDFVVEIKQKAQEKVVNDISKNVDELLTQTRGIQGKVKLAEQKNTQIGEVLKDPNVYKGLKVENNKIIPDEAITIIENRIERLLNAKKEIISEIDDFIPKTSKEIVRQKAIQEINADTKITPADKGSVIKAINKQIDFLPDELSVKELDQFRATFRQSARDAKGLLKRSSEYATLEKSFRDTEFKITDNLQSLGIDKAGEFKNLNNYVKDMINTTEFLDKTLRGQTVKSGRAGIIAGRVVGAIAGSQGGILTAILGSEAGGFVAKILTNNQLGSSVKLKLIKSMTDNPQILRQVEEFLQQTKEYNPPAIPPAEKGGFRKVEYGTETIRLPAKSESIRDAEEIARIQAQLRKPNISRQNTAKTTTNIKKSISDDNLAQLAQEARKYKSAEEFVNKNLTVDSLLPTDRPLGEKTLADLKYTGSKANTQKVKVSPIEDVINKAKQVADSGGDGSVGNYEVYDVLKKVKNGRIKVYHGTSEAGANTIGSGWARLKDGSYLSLTKGVDKEALGVYGAKYYADIAEKYGKGGQVLEFEIPLKNVAIDKTTGELRYVSDKTKSQLTDIWNKAQIKQKGQK